MASLARRDMLHDRVAPTGVASMAVRLGLFTGFATAAFGLAAAFFLAGKGRTSPTGAVVKADSEPTALVAAPGRVRPVSGEMSNRTGQYLSRVDSFILTGKSSPVAR